MLAELVGEDGGVEPIEREIAPIHHFHQRFQHLRLVTHLVTKTKVVAALHEAQRLDLVRHPISSRTGRGTGGSPSRQLLPAVSNSSSTAEGPESTRDKQSHCSGPYFPGIRGIPAGPRG